MSPHDHSHTCSHHDHHTHEESKPTEEVAESHHHHHDHGHSHDHSHCHGGHGKSGNIKKLILVFILTAGYTIAQFIGSNLSGSLALMADSGHMLSDTVSLGVALAAIKIAAMPGSKHHTFGFARFEILAALLNGVLLSFVAVCIFQEALLRMVEPHSIKAPMMLIFAVGGLVVNIISAWLLHAGHEHNLNMRGAYLHVLSDLMGSVGAIIAGILLIAFHWTMADTVISVLIAILVLSSALRLIRDAVRVLMEGTPRHLSLSEIQHALLHVDGVEGLHNLHVWQINSEKIALTAHLVVNQSAYNEHTLRTAQDLLTNRFHFNHTTLQLEVND